ANQNFIPNYGDRYRHGEKISTAFAESAVNQVVSKRMVKKQQMRWTESGAHKPNRRPKFRRRPRSPRFEMLSFLSKKQFAKTFHSLIHRRIRNERYPQIPQELGQHGVDIARARLPGEHKSS